MRVIVLGAGGMLGHKLLQRLRCVCDVAGTIRSGAADAELEGVLRDVKLYPNVDVWRLQSIDEAIDDWRADVVVNCVGIIKQIKTASAPVESIAVNALFPHQLAQLTAAHTSRLIHISTDCVFSGARGNYTEDDPPDPIDLYGRTKWLGEVVAPRALTLRTSIIGQELRGHYGLIDWFLTQRGGRAKGYANARYSGLTTLVFANVVSDIIRSHPDLHGLWHVSGDPTNKFDLLQIVNRVYGLGVDLVRENGFVCDRSLDSTRFRQHTGWRPPSWDDMIVGMHAETLQYA